MKDPHDCIIVEGSFAQCERCRMWGKLDDKPDETGMIDIPLTWDAPYGNRWICMRCYDETDDARLDGKYMK